MDDPENSTILAEGDTNFRPETGLWWNPERSGHGLDIHSSGSRLFMVWYTYNAEGLPVWYLASNELNGDSWTAPMNGFIYDEATNTTTPTQVGSVTLEFFNESQATLSFNINGNKGFEFIEPFLVTERAQISPLTGMYFDPEDPGWGVTVNIQDSTLVVVSYVYDEEGLARWVLGSKVEASVDAQGSIPVDMLFYSNGFEPSAQAVAPVSQSAGTVEVFLEDTSQIAKAQSQISSRSSIQASPEGDSILDVAIDTLGLSIDGDIKVEPSTTSPERTLKVLWDKLRKVERFSDAYLFIDAIDGPGFVSPNSAVTYRAALSLSDASIGSQATYTWTINNRDGASASIDSNGSAATLAAGDTTGTVDLQLSVVDDVNGVRDSKAIMLSIVPAGQLAVTVAIGGDTRVQEYSTGTWTAQAFGGRPPYTYLWFLDTSSGSVGNEREISSSFGGLPGDSSAANEIVEVNVTDAAGDVAVAAFPVIVEASPLLAGISGPSQVGVNESARYNLYINRSDSAVGSVFFVGWQTDAIFESGCGTPDEFCVVSWAEAGSRSVSATVSHDGDTVTAQFSVSVEDGSDSTATLSASLLIAPQQLEPDVAGTWTVLAKGGTPPYDVRFDWDDGDFEEVLGVGASEDGIEVSRAHSYSTAGELYIVTIHVTDFDGNTVSVTELVKVNAPESDWANTSWHSSATCASSSAPFRWNVDIGGLTATDGSVTATIAFHKCPGEGRVTYLGSGIPASNGSLSLEASRIDSRGELGASSPGRLEFILRRGEAPQPNLAGGS